MTIRTFYTIFLVFQAFQLQAAELSPLFLERYRPVPMTEACAPNEIVVRINFETNYKHCVQLMIDDTASRPVLVGPKKSPYLRTDCENFTELQDGQLIRGENYILSDIMLQEGRHVLSCSQLSYRAQDGRYYEIAPGGQLMPVGTAGERCYRKPGWGKGRLIFSLRRNCPPGPNWCVGTGKSALVNDYACREAVLYEIQE